LVSFCVTILKIGIKKIGTEGDQQVAQQTLLPILYRKHCRCSICLGTCRP